MKQHDFDIMTDFCVGCGVSRRNVEEHPRFHFCPANDKLVAVSHIVARRRLHALIGLVDNQDAG